MTPQRRQQIVFRFSVVSFLAALLFWSAWSMTGTPVPMDLSLPFWGTVEYLPLTALSRWWDLLFFPLIMALSVLLLTAPKFRESRGGDRIIDAAISFGAITFVFTGIVLSPIMGAASALATAVPSAIAFALMGIVAATFTNMMIRGALLLRKFFLWLAASEPAKPEE